MAPDKAGLMNRTPTEGGKKPKAKVTLCCYKNSGEHEKDIPIFNTSYIHDFWMQTNLSKDKSF
jgi:hypothetical protein